MTTLRTIITTNQHGKDFDLVAGADITGKQIGSITFDDGSQPGVTRGYVLRLTGDDETYLPDCIEEIETILAEAGQQLDDSSRAQIAALAATVSVYEIGQSAGADYVAEFRALRAELAGRDPDAIAQTDLAGGSELSTIVTDHVAAGVDLWGKGYAEDGGVPMTNGQAIAYLDHEIADANRA